MRAPPGHCRRAIGIGKPEQDYAHIKTNHESLAETLSGLRFRMVENLLPTGRRKLKRTRDRIAEAFESHYDPAYDLQLVATPPNC